MARKYKLPNQQNGQVYLTSHRICYVDKDEPRSRSVTLELKEVERYEFYAGFMKSSPKITIIPKPSKRLSTRNHGNVIPGELGRSKTGSPRPEQTSRTSQNPPSVAAATWVCTICSFSNPVPSNFDPTAANAHTPLAPCLACGIKPTLAHVLKAAITSANNRSSPTPVSSTGSPLPHRTRRSSSNISSNGNAEGVSRDRAITSGNGARRKDSSSSFQCPRCTFSNHPSLLSCEMCGGPLLSQSGSATGPSLLSEEPRPESPGPLKDNSGNMTSSGIDVSDSIKISFRNGGVKIFHERLKGSMTQRKWLLQNAPPAPKGNRSAEEGGTNSPQQASGARSKTAGIAGLEQLGVNMRKNNETIIGNAFEDLEALMSSAKEVVALAEQLARQNGGSEGMSVEASAVLAESATQLGLVTTKDIVGGGSSQSLYLSELARNLAEFLTDDARGVLKKAGGIITLVDLWAMFNRARGGVELVSPMDFEKAAQLWENLKLPVRLRTFRSGVMVVQGRERTDETTIKALLAWLQDLHEFPPETEVAWDWQEFGRGVTAQETAERFSWSLGVAEEELLMAEEHGAVCREEGLEGLKFWVNYIGTEEPENAKSKAERESEEVLRALKAGGMI